MQTAIIKKTRAAAMALCCLVLSATVFDAQAVQLRGVRSCGKWVGDRKLNSFATMTNEAWLIGFLSGMTYQSSKDFLKGTDNESVFLWVDNYCQANPLKDIADAAENLSYELIKQKKL